jgi:hypothetical protein
MRTPGWLGVILALLIALVAGGIGFAIGTTTTLPTDATGVVTTVPVAWHGWGWGFPFFPLCGILFFFLLIAFIFGMARRAAWAGRGWHGPHAWGGPGDSDPRRAMLDDWHRQAHAQPDQAGPTGQPPYGQPTYGQPTYGQPTPGQPPYGPPPTSDPNPRR